MAMAGAWPRADANRTSDTVSGETRQSNSAMARAKSKEYARGADLHTFIQV